MFNQSIVLVCAGVLLAPSVCDHGEGLVGWHRSVASPGERNCMANDNDTTDDDAKDDDAKDDDTDDQDGDSDDGDNNQ